MPVAFAGMICFNLGYGSREMLKKTVLGIFICTLFCSLGLAQIPQVYTVGTGGGYNYSTIQAGINACSNGDRVQVYPGTYTENIDFLGKRIKVQSTGGYGRTIIDGGQNGSVVTIDSGEGNLTHLDGFTVENGTGTSVGGYLKGGGIYINGADPTIKDCRIRDNTAREGAGVYSLGDDFIMYDCLIEENDATIGGGLYVGPDWTSPSHSECSPSIYDNEICNNDASSIAGGVLLGDLGDGAAFDHNEIWGNDAPFDGSGLYIRWNYDGLTLDSNIIRDNLTSNGIYVKETHQSAEAEIVFINTMVYENADYGMYIEGTKIEVTLTYCTFAYNEDEGVYYKTQADNTTPDVFYIYNSIFYGNNGGGANYQFSFENGLWIYLHYCCCETLAYGKYGPYTPQFPYIYSDDGSFADDPEFEDAANSDYRLDSTSPCINESDKTLDYTPSTDFEDDSRTNDYDIGADEYTT